MSMSHNLTSLQLTSNVAAFFEKCIYMSEERGAPAWPALQRITIEGPSRMFSRMFAHSDKILQQTCLQTIEAFTAAITAMTVLRNAHLYPFLRAIWVSSPLISITQSSKLSTEPVLLSRFHCWRGDLSEAVVSATCCMRSRRPMAFARRSGGRRAFCLMMDMIGMTGTSQIPATIRRMMLEEGNAEDQGSTNCQDSTEAQGT